MVAHSILGIFIGINIFVQVLVVLKIIYQSWSDRNITREDCFHIFLWASPARKKLGAPLIKERAKTRVKRPRKSSQKLLNGVPKIYSLGPSSMKRSIHTLPMQILYGLFLCDRSEKADTWMRDFGLIYRYAKGRRVFLQIKKESLWGRRKVKHVRWEIWKKILNTWWALIFGEQSLCRTETRVRLFSVLPVLMHNVGRGALQSAIYFFRGWVRLRLQSTFFLFQFLLLVRYFRTEFQLCVSIFSQILTVSPWWGTRRRMRLVRRRYVYSMAGPKINQMLQTGLPIFWRDSKTENAPTFFRQRSKFREEDKSEVLEKNGRILVQGISETRSLSLAYEVNLDIVCG